ncbi:MAG: hypothetical protein JW726_03830 [Anaerolineales bacterium]|nr:hypothetical protein [Anaerolineales bacterium]
MNIDTGTAVVIGAVLIFYLRLIILQRQRAKALQQTAQAAGKKGKGKAQQAPPRYSIISPRRLDRVTAGVGVAAILAGVLLNVGILPPATVQPYWWVPMAAGIVAFSWLFRL